MQAGKALQVARLRGAELGEMARELVEDLSARFLQELANTTDIDADRKKEKKGEDQPNDQPIVDSTQIFGIKFNTIIQFALVGAIAFFGYRAYKRSQGAR